VDAGASREVVIANACLNKDPFMRPTASSLAEQLFELVIREASQNGKSLPVPLSEGSENEMKQVEELAKKIRAMASERNKRRDVKDPTKLSPSEVQPLIEAAKTLDPKYAFAVGLGYSGDLIDVQDDDDGSSGGRQGMSALSLCAVNRSSC
jgi:hypothetical protein